MDRRVSYTVILIAVTLLYISLSGWTAGTSIYSDMLTKLEIVSKSDYISLHEIGTSVKGRPIIMADIHKPCKTVNPIRILAVCGQHGDEPTSIQGNLDLLSYFADGNDTGLLEKVELLIVLAANPDGAESFTRVNANGADINRDWPYQTQPETRAIVRAVADWKPCIILDEHQWTASDGNRVDCIETFRGSNNLYSDIRDRLIGQLNNRGMIFKETFYDNCNDQSLAHRYFHRKLGIPTFLIETCTNGTSVSRRSYYTSATLNAARVAASQFDRLSRLQPGKKDIMLAFSIPHSVKIPPGYWPIILAAVGYIISLAVLKGNNRIKQPAAAGLHHIEPRRIYLSRLDTSIFEAKRLLRNSK